MFLSSSDRQKMTPAQDLGSDLGKIVHLTAEGQPIPGPWASRGGRTASYYSMGHRNVLGLDFAGWTCHHIPQPLRGKLQRADHDQATDDPTCGSLRGGNDTSEGVPPHAGRL